MKWITRERVKVDRVACPWLIKKFVDPQAEFLFVPADRVVLIPNAIPSSSPTPKEPLVVFGGVVSHRKGIDVLQEAWSRIDAPG